MKVAAYYRISTVLLGQSIDNQRIPIREYCQVRGFELCPENEYADAGVSGGKERRPELDRMLKDARSGKFRVVIVAGLDRLGRNVKHLLVLLDELHALGVKFISLRENIDLSTPQGQMTMTVLAAVAQLERELIRQRIRESLAARKALALQTNSGWRCGPKLKVTELVVREVLSLRGRGLSVRAIERLMGRRISRGSIGRVLKANEGQAVVRPMTMKNPQAQVGEITYDELHSPDVTG